MANEIMETGAILVVDIVGFSKKASTAQVRVIQQLNHMFLSLKLLKHVGLRPHKDWYVNCTGDGFLLVVRQGSVPNLLSEMLQAAQELLHACDEYNAVNAGEEASILLRQGVHVGSFKFGLKVFQGAHAIGKGVNMATRVMGIGDARQILASKQFIEELNDQMEGGKALDLFDPGQGEKAVGVAVKHGVIVSVRAFRGRPGLSPPNTMYGGLGDDWLNGEAGTDIVYGEEDDDRVVGGIGDDILYGGVGDDTLCDRSISGGVCENPQTFYGEDGDDSLWLSYDASCDPGSDFDVASDGGNGTNVYGHTSWGGPMNASAALSSEPTVCADPGY